MLTTSCHGSCEIPPPPRPARDRRPPPRLSLIENCLSHACIRRKGAMTSPRHRTCVYVPPPWNYGQSRPGLHTISSAAMTKKNDVMAHPALAQREGTGLASGKKGNPQ
nr:hypothetical protein SHINE37_120067 [Rhizobiaceae bacterium]